MLTSDKILGIVYLLPTVAGFLGNCILLFLNSFNVLIAQKTISKNLIIIHLAFSNAMVLLFRGIPTTTRLWRVKCLLDEAGIRIITFMQALTRSLSLCSTCLLSVFQAVTISPKNSIWAQLKMRTPKSIITCILLCWIFNLLLVVILLQYYESPKNRTGNKYGCNTGYRSVDFNNKNHVKLLIIICVYDVWFVCLMTFSSAHMVSILYRHKKHVNYIHSNSLSTKISPETRATQAILLLVGIYVLFNIFSPIFVLCMFYFKYTKTWVIHTSAFLSLWYPAVSPFVLISTDNQIPRNHAH
ncbi:vomeronasal type-1 receptor 3-like [Trichosurus vulpecula]|uniref:vomeronasal type-1 receptor 3-like n=1 Tax=Trichosurus vulpecula TaxID=9337 RepID=UPI00186B205B|nr:vomeronasal type-1 receptor 3-like [Trichosurus vulpecula]